MEATREERPGDIEVGIADGAAPHRQRRPTARHAAPPEWLMKWEDKRNKLLIECISEVIGVIIYCWLGQGSVSTLIVSLNQGLPTGGGLMNVGLSYAIGIILAIVICGPISGGHLNPSYTVCFWFYKGFPLYKVPFYIVSQMIGAYIGMLFVLGTFQQQFDVIADTLTAAGEASVIYSGAGPAGGVNIFPQFAGQNQDYFFFCEVIAIFILTAYVFSVLDSSNIFVSFSNVPFLIGIAFGTAIYSFAQTGVCFNAARDLGARFACSSVYTEDWHKCWPPKTTAIAVLTNFLGAFLGAGFQTLFMSDSARPIINHPPDPESVSLRAITRPDYYVPGKE